MKDEKLLDKNLVEKWEKWLQSEEGKKTMLNVANDTLFIIGKSDKLEFVKPKKKEEGE